MHAVEFVRERVYVVQNIDIELLYNERGGLQQNKKHARETYHHLI